MSYLYEYEPTVYSVQHAQPFTRSVNIFGWKSISPLHHHDVDSLHVYLGEPHLLELLNVIGNVFLHAHSVPRPNDIPLVAGSYNSFSPFSLEFNHQPAPGSYTSSIIGINDYVHYFNTAARVSVYNETRVYLFLTIIYDFMAFTSQFYRSSILNKSPCPTRMVEPRRLLTRSIYIIKLNAQVDEAHKQDFSDMMAIFLAIADNAAPIPVMPSAGNPLNFTTPSFPRKRPASPVSAQETPSEAIFKRPRYSEGHDEASDDGEVQLEFSPLTHPRPISSIIDLSQPVYPTLLAPEDLNEVDDVALDFFSSVPMNAMATQENSFIMDSGAGRTGTSDLSLLRNVKPSHATTVTGAFGPAIKPTHTGSFGPHGLDAVYIKSMGPQTLVSLSQFCNAGNQFIGVFTPTEYRMYDLTSALPALDSLAAKGIEAERGTVRNGIYVRS